MSTKIVDKYLLSELFPPFGISLAALCLVILIKEMLRLVELLVSHGVGLFAIAEVILQLLPSFLVLTLPIACIIASISAFSRLAHDKEVIAFRAAGLSLLRLSWPVCVFSFLVFALTLVLAQWGQPWARISLKKVAINLLQDHMTLAFQAGVFNEPIPGLIVYVNDGRGTTTSKGIFIADHRNRQEPLLIVAREYAVLNRPEQGDIALQLFDGTIHAAPANGERDHQVLFATYELKVDLGGKLNATVQGRPSRQALLATLEASHWTDSDALRHLVTYYKDLAFPAATLIFGVLGVPIGIMSKRSGRLGGFAIGVGIVVLYYILNVLGEYFVTTLVLPPWAGAWFPNILFLFLAAVLFLRVSRH